MIDTFLFLAPPIVACIIIAGMLGYFGNHILSRGIIFIDIAVAQIAALGTMIGILLGYPDTSLAVQLISFGFTIVILAVFALTRSKKSILPQEVIIGIFYCVALGIAFLLAEKIPGGSNFITKTITGNVLWVTWSDILGCAVLLSLIAGIHVIFGKKIKEVTSSFNSTSELLKNAKIYDLIFYITFGVVIVKAVPVLGIFLVFILLIAPAVSISLFTKNWKKRVAWSWIIGALGSILGLYISYSLNISNGPAIVCLLGILVFILVIVSYSSKKKNKNQEIKY
ncbi:MAG: metal ABC transporter permease [Bacteroidales bacterium]|nr:metal ABC transporter permease [Bacteroidales bacterium]